MARVAKLHDDEVEIDSALVERLVAEQFPDWAGLPARVVERSGTDNVTFRVGDELAVRLPRTERTQGQVEMDLTWMPRLAPYLPLAIPSPIALGEPGAGYPFSWGVYRWLPGSPFSSELADPVSVARELAGFVRSLREIDTTGAPVPDDDPFSRGTPLAPRDGMFREALDELREYFDTGLLLAAWEESLAADTWDGTPAWIHGDLMSGNVLVADGKLSAVIDFGTARAADPAGDVMAAWFLFEGESRKVYRESLEIDRDTWVRARGWVLSLEIIAIPYYRDRRPNAIPEGQTFIADVLSDFTAR
ncbi:aminoglycoside phosphotransferase family protein [Kribbella kalugense]|uniref:Aminoglycoside phosphotransferase (APT) family kinase protein n=1 Tax=Kribbella kalugense TaxID=2512221 RepID=A0A4R7ZFC9_9ACTN|nr:aminoglycoside phosphotransferase family protein [Kribbella kalugense]TDW14928.1 aminoglycoside phosphotransferase (APT) family kinase protein [Kribbella kalugense]